MVRWIVESSRRFRLLVVAAAAAIMVVGIAQLPSMKVDVLPEFSETVIQVQTEALGLSAGEIERMITVPLEKDLLSGMAWLDEIRSESITSLSTIDLIFEPGTDLMVARQLVQERLALAPGLPNVSKTPEMLQPLSSTNRVLMVEIASEELSQIELSVLARWRMKPHLMGVTGVSNVAIWANRDRQLQVQVDPERLASHGVTLPEVVETTANALWVSPLSYVEASSPGTGGFVDGPNQRLSVQHILPIRTADDLSRVVIERPGGDSATAGSNGTEGSAPRLGDVANVVEDHQPLIGDAMLEDGAGLTLVIEKLPGASVLQVTQDVEAALDDLSLGLPGVRIDSTAFRPASFVETATDNLALLLLIGGILLLIVLALVFLDWRATVVAVGSVAVAAVAAVAVLSTMQVTFNAMLLLGLMMGVAVLVDEAVTGSHAAREASGAVRIRGPLVFATLIILVTAIPLLLLRGTLGAFTAELATGYLAAVIVALVVAVTVTPALAALLIRPGAGAAAERAPTRAVVAAYRTVLARVVRRPGTGYVAIAVGVLLAVVGVAVLPALNGRALVPQLRDRDLLVQWQAAPGTSHPEMMRITGTVVDELRALPGVGRVGAHVGRAVGSDQTGDIDAGQLWVKLQPDADQARTADAVREVVQGYPGISSEVGTYPDHLVRAATGGTESDAAVRLYGDDLTELRDLADRVRAAIASVDGVSSATSVEAARVPTVQVEVDLAAAQEHGLTPGDVRRAAATMVQGLLVGNLFEEQQVFDVMVWASPEQRNSVTDIAALEVDRPDGGRTRLGDVADVRVAANPAAIRHEATFRYLDIAVDLSGADAAGTLQRVESAVHQVDFPADYHAEVVTATSRAATSALSIALYGLAAAIAIFLLLQAALASWRLTGLLYWVLPASAAGGAIALAATGSELSLSAAAGLLAVVGIGARWLILGVRQIARLESAGAGDDRAESDAVLQGSAERVIPVLGATVAIAAMSLPLLFLGAGPGIDVLQPFAVALVGGLITAAALVLFAVPALCARHGAGHIDVALETGGRVIEGGAGHADGR